MPTRKASEYFQPSSELGKAMLAAKEAPGQKHLFQGESGYMTATYTSPTPSMEIMPGLDTDGAPGFWYIAHVEDNTRVEQVSKIGIRYVDDLDE